jgi:hypothetical protein
MSPTRIFLATALALLLAAIGPSVASAGTDIENDEKKIRKYAVTVPEVYDRPRGYCVCHANDYLGNILYAVANGGAQIKIYCSTSTYNVSTGEKIAALACNSDWTPLAR